MYKNLNDYELLYLVSENDEEAYNDICTKYEKLIKTKAKNIYKKCRYIGVSIEDLYGAGLYGLSLAIKNFNDKGNNLFYTVATTYITNEILSFVRNQDRNKHSILSSSMPLDKEIDDEGNTVEKLIGISTNTIDEYYDNLDSINFLNYKYDLSIQQSLIYELKLNNFSNREIATLLDIDYKKVDNALTCIRNKLKKCI